MSEPRIVTPEEAEVYMAEEGQSNGDIYALAYTVATEPERIAAAVIEALESVRARLKSGADL